jgi:molybdopterin converting factor small subunit
MPESDIEVTVKLFAYYRDGRFDSLKSKYSAGTRISDIFSIHKIDLEKDPLGVLLLNGVHAEPQDTLHDGDVVSIFPMLGGG